MWKIALVFLIKIAFAYIKYENIALAILAKYLENKTGFNSWKIKLDSILGKQNWIQFLENKNGLKMDLKLEIFYVLQKLKLFEDQLFPKHWKTKLD